MGLESNPLDYEARAECATRAAQQEGAQNT